jgi:hypothetical protein
MPEYCKARYGNNKPKMYRGFEINERKSILANPGKRTGYVGICHKLRTHELTTIKQLKSEIDYLYDNHILGIPSNIETLEYIPARYGNGKPIIYKELIYKKFEIEFEIKKRNSIETNPGKRIGYIGICHKMKLKTHELTTIQQVKTEIEYLIHDHILCIPLNKAMIRRKKKGIKCEAL